MTATEEVLNAVRRAWRSEPRIGPQAPHVAMELDAGSLTLEGEMPDVAAKKLALELAAGVAGSRDVINGLGISPEEADNDAEITDAVRMALEKDPFVNAGQIIVGTVDAVVTLAGLVPSDSERHMAECDAWYVFGVDRVHNRIEVAPFPPGGTAA